MNTPANTPDDEGIALVAALVAPGSSPLDAAMQRGNPRPAPSYVRGRYQDTPDPLQHPPHTLDPGMITGLDGYGDDTKPQLVATIEAMTALHSVTANIIAAREAARFDPTLNDAGQVLKIADYAESISTAATKKVDVAHASLTKAITAGEEALRQPVAYNAAGSFTAEIRAHVRGLTNAARVQFLSEAILRSDIVTLGAVLGGAPSYLSGITEDMKAALLERHNQVRDPDASKRLAVLRAARERLENAGSTFIASRDKAIGTRWETVKVLRTQRDRAQKPFAARPAQ